MVYLTNRDWELMQDLIVRIHYSESEDQLVKVITEDLPMMWGRGSFVCWNEHKDQMELARIETTETHNVEVENYTEELNSTFYSHPFVEKFDLMNGNKPGIGVFSYRDLTEGRKWDELAIFNDVYRHLEMEDQLIASFEFDANISCNITLNADTRFTQGEKYFIEQLLPHLILARKRLTLPYSIREILIKLSPQLRRVTRLLNQGLSRKAIANELNLSQHTVNEYAAKVFNELHVHSQPELMNLLRKW